MQDDQVKRLERFAMQSNIYSGGRKPAWVGDAMMEPCMKTFEHIAKCVEFHAYLVRFASDRVGPMLRQSEPETIRFYANSDFVFAIFFDWRMSGRSKNQRW